MTQVADELVTELQKMAAEGHAEGMGNNVSTPFTPSPGFASHACFVGTSQKNIRRRVYDALNVLMAMGIITKEKKEIHWVGLPTNSKQDLYRLEVQRCRYFRECCSSPHPMFPV